VLSFEALGGESRRELVFFRLRWLGFAHGEGTPSLEYRGDWCRANFLLSFNPLDQPTNEEECSPFTYGTARVCRVSWVVCRVSCVVLV
jgi:hypothetical protein